MSDKTERNISEAVTDQVKAAVGKAQDEAGKLVDSLVKEGGKIRDQTLKLAEEAAGEVRERADEARGVVESVKARAADTLDNLEQLFEERVARALKRLGVPTRDDLQGIAKRLQDLNGLLQTLTAERPARREPARGEERDDLKLLNGIGPVLEGKLNAAGIHSYRQLAALTDADIDRLESEAINLSGRVRREDWIGQAKALCLQKYGEPL